MWTYSPNGSPSFSKSTTKRARKCESHSPKFWHPSDPKTRMSAASSYDHHSSRKLYPPLMLAVLDESAACGACEGPHHQCCKIKRRPQAVCVLMPCTASQQGVLWNLRLKNIESTTERPTRCASRRGSMHGTLRFQWCWNKDEGVVVDLGLVQWDRYS